ncbi:DUF968 domain-containing protein [Psychrobacter pygoscelis]|uniref:DUF968 domain-containing protein n=1 Tax=Psychrobacter pygoscelis TaxID=2488563 RepID=UPI001039001C|nr:DUF968 domain-containing protein [Psychrobacter pygoscelis]
MSNRDPKRLASIRQLPCCECGKAPRSQAAHSNFGEHGKGMGIKADDKYTIPLCAECHQRFDMYCMSMMRDRAKKWFAEKLQRTNEVLERGETDQTVF